MIPQLRVDSSTTPGMEANVEEGVRATLGVTNCAGIKLMTPCAAKKCHHSCEGLWRLGLISPPHPRGEGVEFTKRPGG